MGVRACEPLESYPIPGLSDLPFVGPILFDHDLLTYLSFLLAPALWWVLLPDPHRPHPAVGR